MILYTPVTISKTKYHAPTEQKKLKKWEKEASGRLETVLVRTNSWIEDDEEMLALPEMKTKGADKY